MLRQTNRDSSCVRKYAVQLTIEKVYLKVRFSCAISASFRVDKEQKHFRGQVTLLNGKADVHDEVQVTANLTFNRVTRQYSQKKGEISVYLISNGRKNIAGTCSIDIADLIRNPHSTHKINLLNQCPDSNAKIQYKAKATFLSQKDLAEPNQYFEFKKKEQSSFMLPKSQNYSPRTDLVDIFGVSNNTPTIKQQINASPETQFRTPAPTRIQPVLVRSYSKQQLGNNMADSMIVENVTTNLRRHDRVASQLCNPHSHRDDRLQTLKKRIEKDQEQMLEVISKESSSHYNKKFESKQVFYKSQLKKTNERIADITIEKQQLKNQLDALRNRLEENQQKVQKMSKQNQKSINEERIRAQKRVAEMQVQIQQTNQLLKHQNEDLRRRVKEALSKFEIIQQQLIEKQKQKAKCAQQNQSSKTQLAKQKLLRVDLEKQLHKQSSIINQLKSSIQQRHKSQKDDDSVKNSLRNSNITGFSKLIEKQSQQIKDLSKKCVDLQKSLVDSNIVLQEECKKAKNLENQVKDKEKDLKKLRDKIEQINTQISLKSKQFQQQRRAFQEKEKSIIEQYSDKVSTLQIQLQFFSDQLNLQRKLQQQQQNKELHTQTNKRKQITKQYESKIRQLQSSTHEKIEYLQTKNAKLEKLKAQLETRIMNMESINDIKSLTKLDSIKEIESFKKSQADLKNNIQTKEESAKKSKEEYEKLLEKYQKSKEKIVENQLNLEDLNHKIQIAQKELQRINEDRRNLRSKNEQLTENIRQINKKLAFSVAEIQKQKQKYEQLSAQMIQNQKRQNKLKQQYQDLQKEYQNIEDRLNESLQQLNRKVQKETNDKKSSLPNLEVRNLKEQLRSVSTDKTAVKQQLRAIEKECQNYKQLIASRDEELNSLQYELEARIANTSQVDKLMVTISDLQKKLTRIPILQATISNIEQQKKVQAQLLSTRTKELTVAQQSLVESSDLINKFSTKVRDLMDQYNKVQEQVKFKTMQLNRLGDDTAEKEVNLKIQIQSLKTQKRLLEDQYQVLKWEKDGITIREAQLEEELDTIKEQLRRHKLSSQQTESRLLQIVGNLQYKSPKSASVSRRQTLSSLSLCIEPTIDIKVYPNQQLSRSSSNSREVAEITQRFNEMREQYQQRIDILRDQLTRVSSEYEQLLGRSQKSPQQPIKQLLKSPKNHYPKGIEDFPYRLPTVEEEMIGQSFRSNQLFPQHFHSDPSIDFQAELSRKSLTLRQTQLRNEVQRLTSQNGAMLDKIQILYDLIMKNKKGGGNSTPISRSPSSEDLQGKATEIMQQSRRLMNEKKMFRY